jgi:aspartate aminotransferase
MAKRVRELRAQGLDVANLTLGEPDFDTPLHIKNAAVEAIRANFTKYTPVAGIPELRQAVAGYFKAINGLEYTPEQVLVSTGAKQSLFNAVQCLVNPGEEVIVPTPFWVSYRSMIELADGIPVLVDCPVEQQYKLTPEQLHAALTPRTKLLFLNSPNNPTGMMYTRPELEALAEVLRSRPDVWVLSDEIYSMISFGTEHVSVASLPGLFHRTVTVTGVAKAFSMTGWRIGVAAGPPELIRLMEKYQGQVTSGACGIAQKAATVAFGNNLSTVYRMRTRFQQRRDKAHAWLQERIPAWRTLLPDGAFYFYPDVSAHFGKRTPHGEEITDAPALVEYLLEHAAVATVPGPAFGTETHLRISFATGSDVLDAAIHRMAVALNRLQ